MSFGFGDRPFENRWVFMTLRRLHQLLRRLPLRGGAVHRLCGRTQAFARRLRGHRWSFLVGGGRKKLKKPWFTWSKVLGLLFGCGRKIEGFRFLVCLVVFLI